MSTMCQEILEDRSLMPTARLNKAILRHRNIIIESQEMLKQLQDELCKRSQEDQQLLEIRRKNAESVE